MEKWYKCRPWLFILLGIIIAIVFILLLNDFEKRDLAFDYVSVIGAFASIVGIAITMAQISSVQKEVRNNSEAILTSHSIADFKKASGWVTDILNAITLKEYGLAHSLTAELVSFLVEQKSNKKIQNMDIKDELDN